MKPDLDFLERFRTRQKLRNGIYDDGGDWPDAGWQRGPGQQSVQHADGALQRGEHRRNAVVAGRGAGPRSSRVSQSEFHAVLLLQGSNIDLRSLTWLDLLKCLVIIFSLFKRIWFRWCHFSELIFSDFSLFFRQKPSSEFSFSWFLKKARVYGFDAIPFRFFSLNFFFD